VRVEWAILCRYCEVGQQGATIIGGGIDYVTVPQIPGQVQVMMAVRLVGSEGEVGPGKEHEIVASVLDPSMQEIHLFTAKLTATQGPKFRPGWEGSAIIPMVHRFVAETPGAYTMNIAVDGRSQSLHIFVDVANPVVPPSA